MKPVAKFRQNMARAEVENSVDRVQSKGIYVIFGEPIERVLDNEAANAIAAWPIEVHRSAPRRPVLIGEIRPKFPQVVAFRTNVVVNNIQDHGNAGLMAGVHQGLQTV